MNNEFQQFHQGLMPSIIELQKIEPILTTLKHYQTKTDTLIFFDLDDVLIMPRGHLGGFRWWETKVNALQKKGISEKDAFASVNTVFVTLQQHLAYSCVETTTSIIFNTIKTMGFNTIGLTGRPKNSADLTQQQIFSLGIEFNPPQPFLKKITTPIAGYTNNIIFCDSLCKGETLHRILTHTTYTPNHVILIDDVHKNLTAVESMLKQYYPTTSFLGIHYTHAATFVPFNEAIAEEEWQQLQQSKGLSLSL